MGHFTAEIEEALNIARKTREDILNASVPLENSLLGFYTVVQILDKEDDLKWVTNELNGFQLSDILPLYRQNMFAALTTLSEKVVDIKNISSFYNLRQDNESNRHQYPLLKPSYHTRRGRK